MKGLRFGVMVDVSDGLASRGQGLGLRVRRFGQMYRVRRVRGEDFGLRVKGLRELKVKGLSVRIGVEG